MSKLTGLLSIYFQFWFHIIQKNSIFYSHQHNTKI